MNIMCEENLKRATDAIKFMQYDSEGLFVSGPVFSESGFTYNDMLTAISLASGISLEQIKEI